MLETPTMCLEPSVARRGVSEQWSDLSLVFVGRHRHHTPCHPNPRSCDDAVRTTRAGPTRSISSRDRKNADVCELFRGNAVVVLGGSERPRDFNPARGSTTIS